MKQAVVFTLLMFVALMPSVISAEEIKGALAPYLQSISVTIRADRGQGSGVLVTREMIGLDGKPVKVNFVWTAAHVLSRLRKTRTVIDTKTGQSKTLVEFRDAEIVQEIVGFYQVLDMFMKIILLERLELYFFLTIHIKAAY